MPNANESVKFKHGDLSDYNGLASKDTNSVYFTEDTCQLFVGGKEYSRPVLTGSSVPTEDTAPGSIYLREVSDGSHELYFNQTGSSSSWILIASLSDKFATEIRTIRKSDVIEAFRKPGVHFFEMGNPQDFVDGSDTGCIQVLNATKDTQSDCSVGIWMRNTYLSQSQELEAILVSFDNATLTTESIITDRKLNASLSHLMSFQDGGGHPYYVSKGSIICPTGKNGYYIGIREYRPPDADLPNIVLEVDGPETNVQSSGTSGVWSYRKWSNGIAECWCRRTYANVSITSSWGALYDSGADPKNPQFGPYPYPFQFSELPSEFVNVHGKGSTVMLRCSLKPLIQESGTYNVVRPVAGTATEVVLDMYVIGRWK